MSDHLLTHAITHRPQLVRLYGEDAAQDTCLRAWQWTGEVRDPLPWLRRVARNFAAMSAKKVSRELGMEGVQGGVTPSHEAQVMARVTLERLPQELRECLEMGKVQRCRLRKLWQKERKRWGITVP